MRATLGVRSMECGVAIHAEQRGRTSGRTVVAQHRRQILPAVLTGGRMAHAAERRRGGNRRRGRGDRAHGVRIGVLSLLLRLRLLRLHRLQLQLLLVTQLLLRRLLLLRRCGRRHCPRRHVRCRIGVDRIHRSEVAGLCVWRRCSESSRGAGCGKRRARVLLGPQRRVLGPLFLRGSEPLASGLVSGSGLARGLFLRRLLTHQATEHGGASRRRGWRGGGRASLSRAHSKRATNERCHVSSG